MIAPLIERMFHSRNAAHIEHWKTSSRSDHMALEEYYKEVVELTDKFVEASMGAFGKLKEKVDGEEKDVAKVIHDDIIWLNANRESITGGIPALGNIIDELTGLHMSVLYKLENLK